MRGLERRIADLCRKAARKVAEGYDGKIRVDERRVRAWLGPRRYSGEVRRRTADPGVATGLAYTAAGGDVLFIEAQAYPGKGRLTITGPARRGDAGVGAGRALVGALAHRRSSASPDDVVRGARHAHPRPGRRGAEGRPVGGRHDGDRDRVARARHARVADEVGMTGELTLTGQVLPIGGVREKVLAAQRAGLKRVILPRENEQDLEDLPAETRARAGLRPRRLDRGRARGRVRPRRGRGTRPHVVGRSASAARAEAERRVEQRAGAVGIRTPTGAAAEQLDTRACRAGRSRCARRSGAGRRSHRVGGATAPARADGRPSCSRRARRVRLGGELRGDAVELLGRARRRAPGCTA